MKISIRVLVVVSLSGALGLAGLAAFLAQRPDGTAPVRNDLEAVDSPLRQRDRAHRGENIGRTVPPVKYRNVHLSLGEVTKMDSRQVALSVEEIDWMRRHNFPDSADLASLATLDEKALRGVRDPRLATLHGLMLMRKGETFAASAVLAHAGAMGSIYAAEESAVAEYFVLQERLGPSIENDDVLRARLEVARIMGDDRVDFLIEKHLPGYSIADRAYQVQAHTTVFLGKLGESAQLTGWPAPGPDPRPNAEAWRRLQETAATQPQTPVEVYVLE